jgi:hypothetical protein
MVMLDQHLVLYLPRHSITAPRRAYIANWMSMVILNMNLDTSVLFLAMVIFDRYVSSSLTCDEVPISVACLSLAAKVDSSDAPPLADYMDYMNDDCYMERLLNAEIAVLLVLDYRISFIPTTYSAMCTILDGMDVFIPAYVNMVFYLGELSIMEYELQQMSPQHLAEACCCYALIVLPQTTAVYDQLLASGLSGVDESIGNGVVILSLVHEVCCQAASNNSPYASTVKYQSAANEVAVVMLANM